MFTRLRRNRKSATIRQLVAETHLNCSQLIQPLFFVDSPLSSIPIEALPGIFRLGMINVLKEIEELLENGISTVALFPVIDPEKKDDLGNEALNPENLTCRLIKEIKKRFPEACLIADVALDPFTAHGHDGILNEQGDVDNDETVEALGKMAYFLAEAGADILAPSDMMDGRICHIRRILDEMGFSGTNLLSYAAKFASCFYGPFREAVGSGLKKGDKKSYQLNPANRREAILEAVTDEKEGADILMVKPALPYLDVLQQLRQTTLKPLAAYQVSGEYAMMVEGARKGWLDLQQGLYESLLCIKRAGADLIFTYGAKQMATSGWIE